MSVLYQFKQIISDFRVLLLIILTNLNRFNKSIGIQKKCTKKIKYSKKTSIKRLEKRVFSNNNKQSIQLSDMLRVLYQFNQIFGHKNLTPGLALKFSFSSASPDAAHSSGSSAKREWFNWAPVLSGRQIQLGARFN